MSTTSTIHGIETTTTTTVAVATLDQTDLILIDSQVGSDSAISTYRVAAGDEDYPATVRVAIYKQDDNINSGHGGYKVNIKLSAYATEIDDTSGDTLVEGDFAVQISIDVPGRNPVFDAALLQKAVSNLHSLLFTGVDGSNVPNAAITDKLKFAIANLY